MQLVTNSSAETRAMKKWNAMHCTLPLLTQLLYVLLMVVLFIEGCQCNRSDWLLYISKSFFVVCAGWWMCSIHITFWMLYPCAVLLYPHHLLNAVSMCCFTLSTSSSECCIHVLFYSIHITFWMPYPCVVWNANLQASCQTVTLHMLIHTSMTLLFFFLHISHLFCFLKCSNNIKTI